MSLCDLKDEVSQLNATELEELAACVQIARKKCDPEWLQRMVRINAEMDAGREHTAEELRAWHEQNA